MKLKTAPLFLRFCLAVLNITLPMAAKAQTVHFVGASSWSQFRNAARTADDLAYNQITLQNSGASCTFHWTANKAGTLNDNRDALGRIVPVLGNAWVVWVADCSDATGATGVTDIWTAVSTESAVAVRAFSAQETSGSGATVQIVTPLPPPANLISPSAFWADGNADVSLPSNVYSAVNGLHVNAALTELRPEDASFATVRAIAPLNTTTYAGLGYQGPTSNIGAPIYSSYPGSTAISTPVKFALTGKADPISHITVPPYTTIPVGVTPLIFIFNNNGASSFPTNLLTGVNPGKAGGSYTLAHLFDGTTACNTSNPAFDFSGESTNITLVLDSPLSGAMNAAEFDDFRTTGNTKDSQETGILNPTRAPYNPLNLPCAGGGGNRSRAIGSDEVIDFVASTPNTLGYVPFSYEDTVTLAATTSVNYMSLGDLGYNDGGFIDPGLDFGNVTFQPYPHPWPGDDYGSTWPYLPPWNRLCPPFCPGLFSFPSVRGGAYTATSSQYLLSYSTNADVYGPAGIAQHAQDIVDSTVPDFVPFATSDGSDGLEVYRSHFTQSGVSGNNGSATPQNTGDGGNTLGGGAEAGGEVGGLIQGPFGVATQYYGTVNTSKKTNVVTFDSGAEFVTGSAWNGLTISINSTNFTILSVKSAKSLTVTPNPGVAQSGVSYSVNFTTAPAVAPGVVNKKQ